MKGIIERILELRIQCKLQIEEIHILCSYAIQYTMGVQESSAIRDTATQYRNTPGPLSTYSKCESLPVPPRHNEHPGGAFFCSGQSSSMQSAQKQRVVFFGPKKHIKKTSLDPSCSSEKNNDPISFGDKWYPKGMYSSLPGEKISEKDKENRVKSSYSISSQDSDIPTMRTPTILSTESVYPDVSEQESRSYSQRGSAQSGPQLYGQRHIYFIKPPSFIQNAGLVNYLQCSQTNDDLFINSEMRINKMSFSSNSVSESSGSGRR